MLLSENITFWTGPKTVTRNAFEDMFPSGNGIYLEPEELNISVLIKPSEHKVPYFLSSFSSYKLTKN